MLVAGPHIMREIGQASGKWGESPFAIVVRRDDDLTQGDVLASAAASSPAQAA